jgi:hypothetical protein
MLFNLQRPRCEHNEHITSTPGSSDSRENYDTTLTIGKIYPNSYMQDLTGKSEIISNNGLKNVGLGSQLLIFCNLD